MWIERTQVPIAAALLATLDPEFKQLLYALVAAAVAVLLEWARERVARWRAERRPGPGPTLRLVVLVVGASGLMGCSAYNATRPLCFDEDTTIEAVVVAEGQAKPVPVRYVHRACIGPKA